MNILNAFWTLERTQSNITLLLLDGLEYMQFA